MFAEFVETKTHFLSRSKLLTYRAPVLLTLGKAHLSPSPSLWTWLFWLSKCLWLSHSLLLTFFFSLSISTSHCPWHCHSFAHSTPTFILRPFELTHSLLSILLASSGTLSPSLHLIFSILPSNRQHRQHEQLIHLYDSPLIVLWSSSCTYLPTLVCMLTKGVYFTESSVSTTTSAYGGAH